LGALVSSLLLLALAGCTLFNQAPVAVIAATPLFGESPLVVEFDGSGSTDAEGDIAAYRWDFGDGSTSTEEKPHHTFLVLVGTQTFVVTLRVTDEGGSTDTASQSIEVTAPESGGGGTGYPVARITADRIIGRTPLTVNFSAADSEPGSGSLTQVRWDFGERNDPGNVVGLTASHKYQPDVTTTFTVTAFVGNTEGFISYGQMDITVVVPEGDAGDEEPTAFFDMSVPLLLHSEPETNPDFSLYEVTFDPGGSYADAGHSIDYYAWDFGDGTWRVETSDLDVTHVYELAAPARTFVVRLYVYDDQGLEGLATANLTLAQPEDDDE